MSSNTRCSAATAPGDGDTSVNAATDTSDALIALAIALAAVLEHTIVTTTASVVVDAALPGNAWAGAVLPSFMALTYVVPRFSLQLGEPITRGGLFRRIGMLAAPWTRLSAALAAWLCFLVLDMLALALVQAWLDNWVFGGAADLMAGASLGPGIVQAVVVAPITEEILARGIVHAIVRARLPQRPVTAAAVTSAAFALMHLSNIGSAQYSGSYILLQVLLSFWIGFFYQSRASATMSVYEPMLMHAFNNATALAVPRSFRFHASDPLHVALILQTLTIYALLSWHGTASVRASFFGCAPRAVRMAQLRSRCDQPGSDGAPRRLLRRGIRRRL